MNDFVVNKSHLVEFLYTIKYCEKNLRATRLYFGFLS